MTPSQVQAKIEEDVQIIGTDPLDYSMKLTKTIDGAGCGYTPMPTLSPTISPAPTPAPEEIFCGSSVSDDTTGLSPISMPTCGTSDGSGGAIWYKFVGTGMPTTLATCGGLTSYDTKLRVYKADAANTCVAGNDDNCPNYHSSVEFTAEAGVEYSVLVQ